MSAEFVTVRFVERNHVQCSDGDKENSQEEGNESESDAEDIAGVTAVAGNCLHDQSDGEKGKGRGSHKGAGQNQPIRASVTLHSHATSDGKKTAKEIIAKGSGN